MIVAAAQEEKRMESDKKKHRWILQQNCEKLDSSFKLITFAFKVRKSSHDKYTVACPKSSPRQDDSKLLKPVAEPVLLFHWSRGHAAPVQMIDSLADR